MAFISWKKRSCCSILFSCWICWWNWHEKYSAISIYWHFWSPQKLSLNCVMSLNRMILCSKLENGLWKLVTKSQVVTKFMSLNRDCTVLFSENKFCYSNLCSGMFINYADKRSDALLARGSKDNGNHRPKSE